MIDGGTGRDCRLHAMNNEAEESLILSNLFDGSFVKPKTQTLLSISSVDWFYRRII